MISGTFNFFKKISVVILKITNTDIKDHPTTLTQTQRHEVNAGPYLEQGDTKYDSSSPIEVRFQELNDGCHTPSSVNSFRGFVGLEGKEEKVSPQDYTGCKTLVMYGIYVMCTEGGLCEVGGKVALFHQGHCMCKVSLNLS